MKKLLLIFIILFAVCLPHLSTPRNCNTCCQSSQTVDCSSECCPSSDTCAATPTEADFCAFATGFLLPRPQGLNSAALFDPFYWSCCDDNCDKAGYALLQYRYNQTFHNTNVARCLFGASNLVFTGSQVPTKTDLDIMADNFGLAPNFVGSIHFKPIIRNHIIDFSSRIELGTYADCLDYTYLMFNASLVNSSWDLRSCSSSQTTTDSTFSDFPECYMGTPATPATSDFHTALEGDFRFGDMQSNWRFGRFILDRSQSGTALANIDLIVGRDFIRCPTWHFGLFAKAVAPTGNRPDARFVFSPIIGNGHHWEFGGGLDFHVDLWDCDDRCLQAYVDGCVTHLFNDSQWRSFDLNTSVNGIPGAFSRYLLLKEFDSNNEYTGHLVNAINFNTRKIKSSFAVQGDASLRLLYRNCGWAVGVGYNVYGRSTEKITGPCDPCCEFSDKRYGIKGITGTCARGWVAGTGLTGENRVLNATESQARIFNTEALPDLVDNPVSLQDTATNTDFITWNSPSAATTPASDVIIAQDSQINGDPAPVYVTGRDLNLRGVPSQLTHKIFAHIDYQWEDECSCWCPYMGVGGEVEFADKGKCRACTINLWGVWVRGGVDF